MPCLGSFFLYQDLEISLRQKKVAFRIHLIFFSSLMDDCPSFPLSNVLKFIVSYNLPNFWLRNMVNLIPITPFCLKA